LPAKSLFVRVLRGSKHLVSNSWVHWTTWLGCTFTVNFVAYLIASGIPIFGNLVSLVGALLGSILCFQPMGCMWLYDNWNKGKDEKSPRWVMMVAWSIFIIIVGTFLTIAGTYGTIVTIIDSYTGGNGAWSCADNSNS
jgi:Mn2+/Fe2+ NRAMP family transporter